MTPKMDFQQGDWVVYPNHGLCIIEKIKRDTIGGVSDTFYNIKIMDTGSSLYIPSNNIRTVGLRQPIGKKDVRKIYKQIEDVEISTYNKWKNRYDENLKLLSSGTPENMVTVLKSLYLVAAKKSLSFREKKMQEKVISLLSHEIAYSTENDPEETEKHLHTLFEKTVDKYLKSNR